MKANRLTALLLVLPMLIGLTGRPALTEAVKDVATQTEMNGEAEPELQKAFYEA